MEEEYQPKYPRVFQYKSFHLWIFFFLPTVIYFFQTIFCVIYVLSVYKCIYQVHLYQSSYFVYFFINTNRCLDIVSCFSSL